MTFQRSPERTADVVKAPAVTTDGRLGLRGFRAYCDRCGYLSSVVGHGSARTLATYHRCTDYDRMRA